MIRVFTDNCLQTGSKLFHELELLSFQHSVKSKNKQANRELQKITKELLGRVSWKDVVPKLYKYKLEVTYVFSKIHEKHL